MSDREVMAYEVCNCYHQVSHTYGLVPEEFSHMSADEYRDMIQNQFADSCDQLFSYAISSLKTPEEQSEFFSAYGDCQQEYQGH